MNTGIRRKVVQKNSKQFTETARRYIWYPLSNLDMGATQFSSPIWTPKIKKGRITLLEAFQYITQVVDETPEQAGSMGNGVQLGEKTMGTDAQVKFLMGNSDGTGFMEKGMVHIMEMIDVDYDTAEEVDEILIGANVPDTLTGFQEKFKHIVIPETPVGEIAAKVLVELKQGVQTAINYCRSYTASLEKEVKEGQAGKIGLKALEPLHEYYFKQIDKPLPEDRAGIASGNQLAQALKIITGQAPQDNAGNFQKEMELEDTKRRLEEAQKTIEEQGEAIKELTGEEA